WGNKDWYVKNRLISSNGIELIREELRKLLYGSENFVERYDRFRAKVKGFGIATLSEFLNMIFPDKFCLWNDKPKTVLPFLTLVSLCTFFWMNFKEFFKGAFIQVTRIMMKALLVCAERFYSKNRLILITIERIKFIVI